MDVPKSNASADPIKVGYSLLLIDIYGVEHSDFTININVFLTLTWFDDRINISADDDEINVDVQFIDNLWKPDVYFYDLKVKYLKIDTLLFEGPFFLQYYWQDAGYRFLANVATFSRQELIFTEGISPEKGLRLRRVKDRVEESFLFSFKPLIVAIR